MSAGAAPSFRSNSVVISLFFFLSILKGLLFCDMGKQCGFV